MLKKGQVQGCILIAVIREAFSSRGGYFSFYKYTFGSLLSGGLSQIQQHFACFSLKEDFSKRHVLLIFLFWRPVAVNAATCWSAVIDAKLWNFSSVTMSIMGSAWILSWTYLSKTQSASSLESKNLFVKVMVRRLLLRPPPVTLKYLAIAFMETLDNILYSVLRVQLPSDIVV